MLKNITLGGREVGINCPPFIIAELSGNHNQSLSKALMLVDEAAKAGADAIKLQTYTAATMTINSVGDEFFIRDEGNLWKGKTLYELYDRAHTPWEWHEAIFRKAESLGLVAFSSPFDVTAVDFLESLDVPCYKIASFEIVDTALIQRVAETGKPVIMSTGMASLAEIEEAVKIATEAGCRQLILLKCTSSYPALAEDANVATIPHMKELFTCHVGLSDHTVGIGVSIAAVVEGAAIVEKHLTLSRSNGGVDSAFSMEPSEFKLLVEESRRAWLAIGNVTYGPTDNELDSLKFRRSLYIVKDILAGETLTEENLKSIRPGLGLSPKYYRQLIGKKVKANLKSGTAMNWSLIGD